MANKKQLKVKGANVKHLARRPPNLQEWRNQDPHELREWVRGVISDWQVDRGRVVVMAEFLRRFGRHAPRCSHKRTGRCTCGLEAFKQFDGPEYKIDLERLVEVMGRHKPQHYGKETTE